jgi:hypothetical protein
MGRHPSNLLLYGLKSKNMVMRTCFSLGTDDNTGVGMIFAFGSLMCEAEGTPIPFLRSYLLGYEITASLLPHST